MERLRRRLNAPGAAVASFALLLAAAWFGSPSRGVDALPEFLALHVLLEMVSIVVAALVFGVVWNSDARNRDGNLLVLGCAFLSAGLVDAAHMLSYPGMPDFITPSHAEKSIFLWMAARFASACALLVVAWREPAPPRGPRAHLAILAASLVYAAVACWIGLTLWQALPALFAEGSGPTALKVEGEYVLMLLFAAAALRLYRRSPPLAAAAALSALGELSLTRYATVTDVFSLLGHVYKVAAYLFLYRAVFVAGVREPYERLRAREEALIDSEERYRTLIAASAAGIVMQRADGFIVTCNASAERILGLTYDQMIGRSSIDPRWHAIREDGSPFPGDTHPAMVSLKTGLPQSDVTMGVHRPDGSLVWISINSRPMLSPGESRPHAVVTSFHDITARRSAETALRESEAGLRHAQEMARLAHVLVREDGTYERWSEGWPRLLGLDRDRLPRSTRDALAMVDAADRESFRAAVIEAARTHQRTVLEYRFQRSDGTLVHVRQTMEPFGEPAPGGGTRWFVTLQDITEQKQAEDRIRRLNRTYAVLSGVNAAIVRIRDRRELFREACRIAVDAGGFRLAWIGAVDRDAGKIVPDAWSGSGADYIERMPLSLDPGADAAFGLPGSAALRGTTEIANDFDTDPRLQLREEARRRGFRSLVVLPLKVVDEVRAVFALYAETPHFFDAEEMRLLEELAGDLSFSLDYLEKEERVRYLAYYDALTGLANRTLFLERLAQYIGVAAAGGHQLALNLINIERFKTLNDTLGRPAGDALLKQVAGRLVELAGDPAQVARVGADHFAVVIPRFGNEQKLLEAFERASRRVDGEPYAVGGTELRIATQAGVALYPTDGADAEVLYRNAEAALRKASSGERYIFYTPQMTARIADRLALENKLRLALEREQFVLHYQPKVDLRSRRITGMEALIRWQDPERGLVSPLEFVPLLEETGLIQEVGAWALRRAVREHRDWEGQGLRPPRVAVNVSALQLRHPDFVARLSHALKQSALPAAIDLEITESILMEDIDASIEKLDGLRALGVNVAVDDFGTGYSSLAYLARLKVQALKIDRSFVARMSQDPDTQALVATVISLAHALRLKVIAEGVETEPQARQLQALECDEMQGYLISRPVPAAEMAALVRAAASG